MVKVNKTYSLDLGTASLLENYCAGSDNWDKTISRSKVVNDAIVWYLSGDVEELKRERDEIHARWVALVNEKHDSKVSTRRDLPWWRRLLLGR